MADHAVCLGYWKAEVVQKSSSQKEVILEKREHREKKDEILSRGNKVCFFQLLISSP